MTKTAFESFILELMWRERVAVGLGKDWDINGRYLLNEAWKAAFEAWGEDCANLIDDYVKWRLGKGALPCVRRGGEVLVLIHEIEELRQALNKYYVEA